jgi:thymidylate synthase
MQPYLDLLRTIKDKGTYKPAARENMPGTYSYFGYQFRHDLSKGFPLLTTKKVYWKGIVAELLWFLRGDTNIKYLLEQGANFWNQDAYNYYKIRFLQKHPQYEQNLFTFQEFVETIKKRAEPQSDFQNIEGYTLGDCGFQYGRVWRNWQYIEMVENLRTSRYTPAYVPTNRKIDQIKNLIHSLKNNPMGRRHLVTAIDPAHDSDLALYWCHALFQFNCRPLSDFERGRLFDSRFPIQTDELKTATDFDEAGIPKYYLDCQLYQRSADVVLGVPFNIASYALLTHILAKICNMIPGEFIHTFGDVHIYENHMDAVNEQLSREPRELPELKIFERHRDHGTLPDHLEKFLLGRISIDDFLKSMTYHDFRITNYNPHPAIDAELSTGLFKPTL